MSAAASVDSYGSEDPLGGQTFEVSPADEIAVDDTTILEDAQHGHAPATIANEDAEIVAGFNDPLMPFLVLGIIAFAAIVAVAALLAL